VEVSDAGVLECQHIAVAEVDDGVFPDLIGMGENVRKHRKTRQIATYFDHVATFMRRVAATVHPAVLIPAGVEVRDDVSAVAEVEHERIASLAAGFRITARTTE
jgi:hypothetical protein